MKQGKCGKKNKLDELVGFGKPMDFATFVLRAKLSRKSGVFGRIPMWGNIRLHEYYPPLSTLIVRLLSMVGALTLYLVLNLYVWAFNKDLLLALLFLVSYFHLVPLLYVGRFAECFGYTLVILAYFTKNDILSGIFLGLAALSHPLPLAFGSVVLISHMSFIPYVTAFLVCGWWYIPFIVKRRKLSFLKERRSDKVFGVYLHSWASMVNILLFLFSPPWISILGDIWWVLPVHIDKNFKVKISKEAWHFNFSLLKRKPFFLSQLPSKMHFLNELNGTVAIVQKNGYLSTNTWAWACAAYLLDRDVVVYNGLPATEVPADKLSIPSWVKVIEINES